MCHFSEGRDYMGVINERQLRNFQRFVNKEFYKLVNIFKLHIKLMREEILKFHEDPAEVQQPDVIRFSGKNLDNRRNSVEGEVIRDYSYKLERAQRLVSNSIAKHNEAKNNNEGWCCL